MTPRTRHLLVSTAFLSGTVLGSSAVLGQPRPGPRTVGPVCEVAVRVAKRCLMQTFDHSACPLKAERVRAEQEFLPKFDVTLTGNKREQLLNVMTNACQLGCAMHRDGPPTLAKALANKQRLCGLIDLEGWR